MIHIGVISDTHDVVRECLYSIFRDCQIIIHAGDIGNESVINQLAKIAPVIAVRGNVDKGIWPEILPESRVVSVNGHNIFITHDLKKMKRNLKDSGYSIVISGHSHKYNQVIENDILYLNPGGAGRKRLSLPISVAMLSIDEKKFNTKVIYLS